MEKIFVLFLLCIASSNAAITRSLNDIKSFEEFLRSSVNGKPIKSVFSELSNAEENSEKYEGDILLTEEQIQEMIDDYSIGKNALSPKNRLWANGVIPYYIHTPHFTSVQINAIEEGVSDLNYLSCLTVKKRTNEYSYINITGKSDGCYASVGFSGGNHNLNLEPSDPGSGCFRHGTIVHELLHIAGFFHMHSTYDRDEWVHIVWEKIRPGSEYNFRLLTTGEVTNLGESYDYGSVMHYSEYGFSVDGSKTIIPFKSTTETIGQRVGMSRFDIIKLNRLYGC